MCRKLSLILALLFPIAVFASSHREAPAITEDPAFDNTDVYAFLSPDLPNTLTLIANFYPFEEPGGGPNYFNFSPDGVYEIHIDNNGDAKEDITYQFQFRNDTRTGDTFLYNTGQVKTLDDANLNFRQLYTLTRIANGTPTVVGTNFQVAPANIGPRSMPNYDALANAAIFTLPNSGGKVFAGPRDDPFFVDVGSIFDLLALRPLQSAHLIPTPGNAAGVDTLKGYNVLTIALQVPVSSVTRDGQVPGSTSANNAVIGVWSTASRTRFTVRSTPFGDRRAPGATQQVSRLGMPLVNEVVVPRGSKDLFNASQPAGDGQFLAKVTDPELPKLMKLLYGVNVPPAPRNDLVAAFLTGVDGLNKRNGDVPSEMLRINLAIPPAATPKRLGVLDGDVAGFPNGRRLGDDVVDIELRVAAGVLVSGFNVSPNNALTDGVDANDKPFLTTFPYVAPPSNGYDSKPHGQ